MKKQLFIFMLLPFFVVACAGDTKISLSADKTEISAGGTDFATITAKVYVDGDLVKNAVLDFETSAGRFENGDQDIEVTTDASGIATVKLYSEAQEGQATVTAEYYDDATGISATQSIAIRFGTPSGDQSPVDGKFVLTCDSVNIGAFRIPQPEIRTICRINATSRSGTSIPASAMDIQFQTEAGSITIDDESENDRIFIYNPKGGNASPVDVPPDTTVGEPSRFDGNGLERNPRDGLVTIIAVVNGEEEFTDANGNGQYDQGEVFTDAAEPFVDANDNDQWDMGELYIDTNQNGQWDVGNGKWDSNTKIMAIFKILWTGALDSSQETSRIEAPSLQIFDGGSLTVSSYLLDANMNPIAGFQGNGDYVEFVFDAGEDADSDDDVEKSISNEYGFAFNSSANNERKRWKILPNTFEPKAYTFDIKDYESGDDRMPGEFSLSVKTYTTPGKTVDDDYLDQLVEDVDEVFKGTCD